jgi:hypothetical protein
MTGITDDYLVTVSGESKEVKQRYIKPPELLRKYELDPAQYVLYRTEEDQRISNDYELDLTEEKVFDAIPEDTSYGSEPEDPFLEDHIETLEDHYEVEVDTRTERKFTHVIVRNFPIPSDAYNKETTDVMIRVHENYPVKPLDWVYVDTDLRLTGGGKLRKSHGERRVNDWQALSWHIPPLDGVEWEPFETDLKWYLETVVTGRLRQGN